MIVRPDVTSFILSLEPERSERLRKIYEMAVTQEVPVIRPETESLLKLLITVRQPREVLEVGTAIGYSALILSEFMGEGHITTIEKYPPRLKQARENLSPEMETGRITLIEGDAEEILGNYKRKCDMIFMDAAKGQYLHWLPFLRDILVPGGILVSDNVLQEGRVAVSRFAVERRDRTIHSRMREYLYTLTHTSWLQTAVLPSGDGIAVSVKIPEDTE